MKEPVWVRRDVVLAYHDMLLSRHGGGLGIRDEGMLDSALGKPKNLYRYKKPSLFDLSASYGYGLIKGHAFVDGNKRIGFATTVLFLEINGMRFEGGEVDSVLRTLAVAAGELDEASFAKWLEQNTT